MHFSAATANTTATLRHLWYIVAVSLLGVVTYAQEAPEVLPEDAEEEEIPMLRRYAVELIVFENGSEVVSGNEVFPPEELPQQAPDELTGQSPDDVIALDASGVPITMRDQHRPDDLPNDPPNDDSGEMLEVAEEIDLNTPIEEFPGYDKIRLTLIDPEQYTMTELYEKLETLDAYKPVLHSGWIQAAFEEDATPAVRLRTLGTVPLRFDGNLTLYLGRYLHLVVDLTLEEPQEAANPYATGATVTYDNSRWTGFGYEEQYDRKTGPINYRINENRIVGDGDLRLFDHPKFGVLARITRLEDQPEDPEADPHQEQDQYQDFDDTATLLPGNGG